MEEVSGVLEEATQSTWRDDLVYQQLIKVILFLALSIEKTLSCVQVCMCKGACVCICHVCGNQKPLLGALLEMLPLSFEAESLSGTGWMIVPGWLVKELLGCPRLCHHKCTLPSLPLFLLFCDMGSEGQIWVLCFYGRHFINGAVSPARFLFKFRHSSGFYGDNVISKGDNSYLFLSVYLPFGPILPLVALIEMPVPCWM